MSDFTVDIERETDGRWIGEVSELSGVLVYGSTREEAVAKAKALAFRVLADRLEHGEDIPEIHGVFAVHVARGQVDAYLLSHFRIARRDGKQRLPPRIIS